MKNADRRSQYKLIRGEFERAGAYAAEYSDTSAQTHFFRTRVARVGELLQDFEKGRVLDCGCGPSVIATRFSSRGIRYCGLDVSLDMIRHSVASLGQGGPFFFTLGGIESLPFRDGAFDVVLCLGSFEYVLDGRLALSEISRVASPDATVIVSMHNASSPSQWWSNHVWGRAQRIASRVWRFGRPGPDCEERPRAQSVIRSERQMRRFCETAGLQVVDVVYYDFNVLPPPLDAVLPTAALWLSERLQRLSRSPFRFLGSAFLVKCRKSSSPAMRVDGRLLVQSYDHEGAVA